jgi:hypothetical protein
MEFSHLEFEEEGYKLSILTREAIILQLDR